MAASDNPAVHDDDVHGSMEDVMEPVEQLREAATAEALATRRRITRTMTKALGAEHALPSNEVRSFIANCYTLRPF